MSPDEPLLDALEHFVEANVHIGSWSDPQPDFREKIDVLQRAMELLRLRTGSTSPSISMREVLSAGMAVEKGAAGHPLIRFRTLGTTEARRHTADGWKQSELQAPLLLYVAAQRRQGAPVGNQIAGFIEQVATSLSPLDMETTRTGVTRVTTTTRSAARSLKLHGLLTVSSETEYKTWRPSVIGILVCGLLTFRGKRQLIPRTLERSEGGQFGASTNLGADLSEIVRSFQRRDNVAEAVELTCGPNADVLAAFRAAIDTVVDFVLEYPRTPTELHENRRQANELILRLARSVPDEMFAQEFAVDLALRQLVGRPTG